MASNILFCITGPSGSGKTTVMKEVMNNEVGSCTTRDMREGEVQGREYDFIHKVEFEWMLAQKLLAEYTEYDGNYYGTTMEELRNKTEQGHAYVICDNHGFQQFADVYDNVVSIFLYADPEDCGDNMLGRGDSQEKTNGRLKTYFQEVNNKGQYDYVVKNKRGFFNTTVEVLQKIVAIEIASNWRRDYESITSIR